jgi:Tfp pilus assembly protein PilF
VAKRRSRGTAAARASVETSAPRDRTARARDSGRVVVPSSPAETRRTSARAWWTVALAIVVLACAVYANSLGGEFLFDDVNAIVTNPVVRANDVVGIFTGPSWWSLVRGYAWRPVTTVSFALNHALHGLEPAGYHLVNVLLHAGVSVLVFAVFTHVTAAPLLGAIAALLFAAHPVHTEAVASVVGRAELLAAGGFFLAWLLFLRADERRSRVPPALLEGAAVVVFFAALLAKENAITLVAVLVFVDLLLAPRAARFVRLRAHLGRYVALGAAVLVFVAVRHAVLGDRPSPISILDNPLVELDPLSYELTAIKVAGLYLWRLLAPWRLAADYSYRQLVPVASLLDPMFLVACAGVVAVPVLIVWTWRRAPAAALGLGILALTFVVASNFVFPIGTIMGERLIYLPSAGFCLAAAVLLERVTRRADGASALVRLRDPRLAVPLVIVLALYGARTWSRNRVWHDRLVFFSTMVREAPESARSHRELAAVLADHGKFELARGEFERALTIRPDDAATLYNFGNALMQERRPDDAIHAYERALATKPDFADALVNLGNAESMRGDHQAALTWMRRALALTPRSASLHMNVANELFRLGSHAEARAEYEAALAIAPTAAEILTNYGAFLLATGDHERAADVYRRAGDVPMALVGLSATYRAQGKASDARAVQTRAAALFPTNPAVRQMGEVLERDAAVPGVPGG